MSNTKVNTEIKVGMIVSHKYIKTPLLVVADEKGPAYTGNEFSENEIAISYAIQEYKSGNLTVNTEERELFTEGNWEVAFGRWAKAGDIVGFAIRSGEKDIVSLNISTTTIIHDNPIARLSNIISQKEAEANAHLIAASKDMYFGHKKHLEEGVKILNKWANSEIVSAKDLRTFIGAVCENSAAILLKANPNYKP